MLGTQAQYSSPARPTNGYGWRKPIIVVVLLALVGIGGWWAYRSNTAGQTQSVPAPLALIPVPAVSSQLPVLGTDAVETTATSSATRAQPAVQTTASANQAAEPGLKLASLAGVAEVAGTPVWSDEGKLLTTLESGSHLTVQARTSDGTWLAVATGAGSGWAQTSTVVAYGLQNLTTAAVPAAVVSANTQAGPASVAATSAAATAVDPGTAGATLSLADLVSTTSSAAGELPAPAASVQLAAKITATGTRLNVRSGPGTDYQVVAKAGDGTEYQAVGRSAAGDWLLLRLNADTGDVGWVSSGYVEVSGDIQTLPVHYP